MARARKAGTIAVGEPELVATVGFVLEEERLRADIGMDGAQELAEQLHRYNTGKPTRLPAAQQAFAKPERKNWCGRWQWRWWGDRQLAPRIEQPPLPPVEIDCRPPTFDELIKAL